jgi:hypothetical protein
MPIGVDASLKLPHNRTHDSALGGRVPHHEWRRHHDFDHRPHQAVVRRSRRRAAPHVATRQLNGRSHECAPIETTCVRRDP